MFMFFRIWSALGWRNSKSLYIWKKKFKISYISFNNELNFTNDQKFNQNFMENFLTLTFYLNPLQWLFSLMVFIKSMCNKTVFLIGYIGNYTQHKTKSEICMKLLVSKKLMKTEWSQRFTCYFYTFLYMPEAASRGVLSEKVFLKILQNSQENTSARVSFLIKLQALWQ